jgi:hypothetical protein
MELLKIGRRVASSFLSISAVWRKYEPDTITNLNEVSMDDRLGSVESLLHLSLIYYTFQELSESSLKREKVGYEFVTCMTGCKKGRHVFLEEN